VSNSGRIHEASGAAGPSSRLTVAPLPDRPGLSLSGEIDLSTRAVLEAALESVASYDTDIHLDLAGVGFIDVGGATVLMRAADRCPPGKHVVLHHVSPRLQKLIDLLWGRPPRAIELDAA
jgi:anti-anti-sigma factor